MKNAGLQGLQYLNLLINQDPRFISIYNPHKSLLIHKLSSFSKSCVPMPMIVVRYQYLNATSQCLA